MPGLHIHIKIRLSTSLASRYVSRHIIELKQHLNVTNPTFERGTQRHWMCGHRELVIHWKYFHFYEACTTCITNANIQYCRGEELYFIFCNDISKSESIFEQFNY